VKEEQLSPLVEGVPETESGFAEHSRPIPIASSYGPRARELKRCHFVVANAKVQGSRQVEMELALDTVADGANSVFEYHQHEF